MHYTQHPLNALPRGHRLHEYELLRVLGFGGFGMTYLGFDHNLDKAVAIKEYLPDDIAVRTRNNSVIPKASQFRVDFDWGMDRFLDEARTLACFDHRHIVKVYRFFKAHGTAYIVMEYAEGETLSEFLKRNGTLTETELKAILNPILDGLEVVHKIDFLHRDIKPGNIIIRDEDGLPVLLDFGSARQAIGVKTRSITSILTPGYAPIEQYSSRGGQGPWTDIYALGGVCYCTLTGQAPDDAPDRLHDDPLIPVSKQCSGQARQRFLAAVDWALAVDENNRPQSIGEWRTELIEKKSRRGYVQPTIVTASGTASSPKPQKRKTTGSHKHSSAKNNVPQMVSQRGRNSSVVQGSIGNVIAALCSFFIPGLGQLIQGRLLIAIIQFFAAGLLWMILMGWVIHLWSALNAARWKP